MPTERLHNPNELAEFTYRSGRERKAMQFVNKRKSSAIMRPSIHAKNAIKFQQLINGFKPKEVTELTPNQVRLESHAEVKQNAYKMNLEKLKMSTATNKVEILTIPQP